MVETVGIHQLIGNRRLFGRLLAVRESFVELINVGGGFYGSQMPCPPVRGGSVRALFPGEHDPGPILRLWELGYDFPLVSGRWRQEDPPGSRFVGEPRNSWAPSGRDQSLCHAR